MTPEEEQQGREAMARHLEGLAEDIRKGEVTVTRMDQAFPYRRYWAKQRWEHFRLLDTQVHLNYFHAGQREAEQERLEKYLAENPEAQCYGDGGPLGRPFEITPLETLEQSIDVSKDHLLVYLNGEVQGMVIEADSVEGYIVKRTWEGSLITLKGDVKITFNNEPVVRAETDTVFRARIARLKKEG